MSEEKNTKEKKDSPKAAEPAAKGTVKHYFDKSEARPYLIEAFCLATKLTPQSPISEPDFNRKLKEFQTRKIG